MIVYGELAEAGGRVPPDVNAASEVGALTWHAPAPETSGPGAPATCRLSARLQGPRRLSSVGRATHS